MRSLLQGIEGYDEFEFTIFLVDDGSSDGTSELVEKLYPEVKIIQGSGTLYWAGGMRLAWDTALKTFDYDAYLLLNDDVILEESVLAQIKIAERYSLNCTGKKGIYSGITVDQETHAVTYGGYVITRNSFLFRLKKLTPQGRPQICHLANANILWVDKSVVEQIGIFDAVFTHGIADYDYSLRARKHALPVFVVPGVCGYCSNDHGVNWKDPSVSLKERIEYLKSPKGLSSTQYLFFIRRHFPFSFPYFFVMLWMKTLFPQFWKIFKKVEG